MKLQIADGLLVNDSVIIFGKNLTGDLSGSSGDQTGKLAFEGILFALGVELGLSAGVFNNGACFGRCFVGQFSLQLGSSICCLPSAWASARIFSPVVLTSANSF